MFCGCHPLLSGVSPGPPAVRFRLSPFATSSVRTRRPPFFLRFSSAGVKRLRLYNLQLLIPRLCLGARTEKLGCWENLRAEVDVTRTPRPVPGAQVLTPPSREDAPSGVCVVAQPRTWSGLALGVLVPSSLQTPGCSSEEPLALCCVCCYCLHFLGRL